jgi:hypothetical protein
MLFFVPFYGLRRCKNRLSNGEPDEQAIHQKHRIDFLEEADPIRAVDVQFGVCPGRWSKPSHHGGWNG